nr:MAG TPA: hypothetical protein [Caudoviricetes sp.]
MRPQPQLTLTLIPRSCEYHAKHGLTTYQGKEFYI